jgi:hypothetical protein
MPSDEETDDRSDMADASGESDEEARRTVPWHNERPSYIDDEECRLALEELLHEAGVLPSTLRSRTRRA